MKKIFGFLFGCFGYAKVPKEAVMLSICQETFFEKMIKHESSGVGIKYLKKHLEIQKTLTDLLRSARKINFKKGA